MIKSIKSIVVLVSICAVMAVLLAVTNSLTAPIIAQNQAAAANEALLEVMPEGKNFQELDISSYTLPASVTQVYTEESGGYVFILNVAGYAPNFVIMCGITADGAISGTKVLSSNETPSIGGVAADAFAAQLLGQTADSLPAVDIIADASYTTRAYKAAMQDAFNAIVILGGGYVDLRTEEEILRDNLTAALPAGEGVFSKLFIVEVIEGIDAVYTADNGKGYVYVIGEQFIGVDESGKCDNATVAAAHAILSVTSKVDIDISAYGDQLPKNLISAQKTATGNYILEVKGAGYGIKGGDEYHPASGEYIVVRVSITAAGKIIDTFTVSQKETTGLGDACANEKFYGQFDGKTEANYQEIDAISGATLTTKGYLKAIEHAFATVTVLEGGSVDLRTEEEILRDNLSAALPAAEGKFSKLFIAEVIEGIDAVYTADNGKGYVYVIGEQFIAVDESGSTENEVVAAAHAILSVSEKTDVDLSAFEGLPKNLLSAQKTATGNYIFEVKGAGYGIKGGDDYHPASGEYIVVRVSITAAGTIIDTLTVSQKESAGIGDACANEKFYGQFDGKTEETYKEIDAISGATMTTDGYLKAIEHAFASLNIMEGGAANE